MQDSSDFDKRRLPADQGCQTYFMGAFRLSARTSTRHRCADLTFAVRRREVLLACDDAAVSRAQREKTPYSSRERQLPCDWTKVEAVNWRVIARLNVRITLSASSLTGHKMRSWQYKRICMHGQLAAHMLSRPAPHHAGQVNLGQQGVRVAHTPGLLDEPCASYADHWMHAGESPALAGCPRLPSPSTGSISMPGPAVI